MCNFFSLTSDGLGNIKYFDWEQRQQILRGELNYDADSHTSINDYYGYKGVDEDVRNKYEYNPLTDVFTVDMINGLDDRTEVERKVRALDFKTICEPLIIKPIVNPFEVKNDGVTDKHIELLKEWIKVRDSVRCPVWLSIEGSIEDSAGRSVWSSVWDSIVISVKHLVRYSVRYSVDDFMNAYTSSFFNIKKWKCIDHEPYKNPFQCAIDLWNDGFVASFDGEVWRLHSGKDGRVVYEMEV